MLRVHSRLDVGGCQVRYERGVLTSNAGKDKWVVLKDENGQWTCVTDEDLSMVRSYVKMPESTYSVVEAEGERVALGGAVEKICVSGKIVAHIHWEKAGDVQLFVETGSLVYFYTRNAETRLVAVVRNRGALVVEGRAQSVAASVDLSSRLVATEVVCTKPVHVTFAAGRPKIAFPHAHSDCRAVDDDTPEETQCALCYQRVKNARFSPCGHVYACLVCAERLQCTAKHFRCPLCRADVSRVTPC